MIIQYHICVPSELSAGLRGVDDKITIVVESGDPGGESGGFQEFMRTALALWYDEGIVTVIEG